MTSVKAGRPKTVEEMLPVSTLSDLFLDADTAYWSGQETRDRIWEAITSELIRGGSVPIAFAAEPDGVKDFDTPGLFTIERFRAGIVERAIERFLRDLQDAEENDAALQYAVFGEIIFG